MLNFLEEIHDDDFYFWFGAEYKSLEMIESLLRFANIPENVSEYLYKRLRCDLFTEEEAEKLIEYLQQNQIDRVNSGIYYTQTDIKYKLKNGSSTE